MRKLVFGALATVAVALQPSFALAQRVPSDFIKEPLTATNPTITTFPETRILQAIAVSATTAGTPAGVTATTRCLLGAPGGTRAGAFEPIRFVGNVLCLDPGPEGEFRSFALNCPAGTEPAVQGVKLIKTVPRIPKCPDVFPGGTFVQTPQSTGIRTWWPLKFTPCETTFLLEVEFACVRSTFPRNPTQVRVNRFPFRVVITPDTLSWLVHALHNQPLGVCEVPCITDEGLFDLLIRQSDEIARQARGLPGTVRALNTAIDVMEATVIARCLFLLSVFERWFDERGNLIGIKPCVLFPTDGPWGNFTIADFGFGIVDTIEHPCCCKLIADLFCLKGALIGNDP